jgi:hypothetical protein
MVFFKINGITIAAPKELKVSFETLDKTERTMDGTMVVDIIGEKRKVDVAWEYLSKEDMATLSNAARNTALATISFHSKETGQLVTMEARGENLSYAPHFDWARNRLMWKSVSIVFREK